jgi:hypothetical protein
MGSSNNVIHGMNHSGGHLQFNPIGVDGSVVDFEIQTQGGNNSVYSYNYTYGAAAPPPGQQRCRDYEEEGVSRLLDLRDGNRSGLPVRLFTSSTSKGRSPQRVVRRTD